MRVLEVLGSLHRGGAETMIMNYYRAFDKKLCQFDFVIHAEFEGDYRAEAESLGAKVILIKRPGELGVLKYIQTLMNVIESFGPYDAVHIHTNYQAFMAMVAAHRAGIKNIIVHSHSTSFKKIQLIVNRIFMNIYKVKKVACGVAAGDSFFGKNSYIVLNNAIDVKRFRNYSVKDCAEKREKLFGKSVVIGNIGRLTPQKNHDFVLDLAERILKSGHNIVFACYGEGEDKEKLLQKVSDRKLTNVKFMGVTDDVVTAYHMFDVFILPSRWEGFPVTLVEAQLTGVYSLASDRISRECDLGINMLEYLPLNLEIWEKVIFERIGEKVCVEDRQNMLDEYDVNVQWKKLYQIYKG